MVKKGDCKFITNIAQNIFIIFIFILLIASSKGWTYIKYNDKLYVINTFPLEKDIYKDKVMENLGVVKKNTIKFLKPLFNNTSNGVPAGSKILKISESTGIFIELNGMYVYCGSTEDVGWGNGPKIRIKGNKILY